MDILIFILVLAVLIFVHEFGHFITAKWAKLRVEEFGFGFPPRIIGKKIGETIYSVNWIPFGGFVKIFGEDGEEKEDEESFAAQPAWKRFLILFAGPAMNFMLGLLLVVSVLTMGTRAAITPENRHLANDLAVTITQVAQESPAEEAGLRPGDLVRKVVAPDVVETEVIVFDDSDVDSFVGFVNDHRGDELKITVQRGEETRTFAAVPRTNPPENEGALGIAISQTGFVDYPLVEAAKKGTNTSIHLSGAVLAAFGGMVKDVVVGKGVSGDIVGPVGLVGVTSMAYDLGLVNLLQLIAVISLNLAVLNLLPIPALDGGRILFLAIEKIKGSPVPQKYEKVVHFVGFVLLILLLVVVTIKDVANLL